MISEQWIRNDVEGSDYGPNSDTILEFACSSLMIKEWNNSNSRAVYDALNQTQHKWFPVHIIWEENGMEIMQINAIWWS